MKNLNPLKIGKRTFWVSFIIGNIFMFSYLLGRTMEWRNIDNFGFVGGYIYLYGATAINLLILFILLIVGISEIEKRKQCFKGIAIMLINIPLALLYAYIGIAFGLNSLFWIK